jgi:hypothetical protein
MRERVYSSDGTLISVREGVYGRQATPEEVERFKKFSDGWIAGEPERLKRDREALVECMAKYMTAHGYSQRDIDMFVRRNTPSKLEAIGITGFKRR